MNKKPPEFAKYSALHHWFRSRPADLKSVELTFAQVEEILGKPLTMTARKFPIFWTNKTTKMPNHRNAWMDNGWKVAEVDMFAQWVVFAREEIT